MKLFNKFFCNSCSKYFTILTMYQKIIENYYVRNVFIFIYLTHLSFLMNLSFPEWNPHWKNACLNGDMITVQQLFANQPIKDNYSWSERYYINEGLKFACKGNGNNIIEQIALVKWFMNKHSSTTDDFNRAFIWACSGSG